MRDGVARRVLCQSEPDEDAQAVWSPAPGPRAGPPAAGSIHWQSGAAHLLPRLLRGRQAGPVFLTDRRAPSRTPALDVCPITGRARLSCRRAAGLFTEATTTLDSTGAGWTLHQLRHSDLTHEAEEGASTPMLLARSRHASVRSLERYARPGVDAVGAYVARRGSGSAATSPGGAIRCLM